MKKTAIFFGVNSLTDEIVENYSSQLDLLYIIDNNSKYWTGGGEFFFNLRVEPPSDRIKSADYIIIVATAYRGEMEMQLRTEFDISSDKIIYLPWPNKLEDYVGKFPKILAITLGADSCINSCLMCPQHIERPHTSCWLDLDILKKAVSEMIHEDSIFVISCMSEPLLAPNLLDAIKIIREKKPKSQIMIDTCGSVYDEKVMEELFKYINKIKISLNVITAEDYRVLMGTDNFDAVVSNIWKSKSYIDTHNLDVTIIVQISKFKKLKYSEYYQFAKQFKDKGIWVHLNDIYDFNAFPKFGELSSKLKNEGFEPVLEVKQGRYPCASLFGSFNLVEDGCYYPCHYVSSHGMSHVEDKVYSLGAASQTTLNDVCEQLGSLQEMHLKDDYSCLICRDCNAWTLGIEYFRHKLTAFKG